MIGRLNHVAIAVRDLARAARLYRETLGAEVSEPVPQPERGVTGVVIMLPNTKVELIAPLGDESPIENFLARNPDGGIHHVCYEVTDIRTARDQLLRQGARVLGDGEPKIGAHGKPVLFLHPKDFCGTFIEIEQASTSQMNCGSPGAPPAAQHCPRHAGMGDRGFSILRHGHRLSAKRSVGASDMVRAMAMDGWPRATHT